MTKLFVLRMNYNCLQNILINYKLLLFNRNSCLKSLLVLDKNTRNSSIIWKLFALDWNIWYHNLNPTKKKTSEEKSSQKSKYKCTMNAIS